MKLAECPNGHDVRLTTRLLAGNPYCGECSVNAQRAARAAREATPAERARNEALGKATKRANLLKKHSLWARD